MPTFTAKALLEMAADTENYDVDVVNGNSLKIDSLLGVIICTSLTRPSSPYAGQAIYETDTGQFGVWRADLIQWVLPRATMYASATRPTTGLYEGFTFYRTDRDWIETWDGALWRVRAGIAVCSSTSDRDTAITHPYNGQFAFTTDTEILWWYRAGSSAWVPIHDRGTIGGRRITHSSNLGSAISTSETIPTNMNSGSLALLANRRYVILVRAKTIGSATNDVFLMNLKLDSTAGSAIREFLYEVRNNALGYTIEFSGDYETGVAETRNMVVSAFRISGTGNLQFQGGGSGNIVGVEVEDKGPAGKLTTTS